MAGQYVHYIFLLKMMKKERCECVLVTDRLTREQNENQNERKEKAWVLFSFYYYRFLIDV